MHNILGTLPLDALCTFEKLALLLMLIIGWGIWKETNRRIFHGLVMLLISLAMNIKLLVVGCTCMCQVFRGVKIFNLYRDQILVLMV